MGDDYTGKKLGPFELLEQIGEGAMGAVYRAQHRKTGKFVAIKMISKPNEGDSTFSARFEREIKLLSQFRHPNIVRIHGDSEYHGVRYYAMELIDGRSLESILGDQGKLSIRRTIAYGVQICEALQEIHRVGVIHRDLKPANLMVTRDGQVKLMDFGIAKDVTALHTKEITQADKTVGTVSYMSPEQLAGQELTRKSDMYALGILLYRMLTGRLPFTGETMFEYMEQRMKGVFALPSAVDPDIPREFDDLISAMLKQDPNERPRDTYVVMQKLMDIGKARGRSPRRGPRPTPPWSRRSKFLTIASAR
jgi:serine/threonine protein kinase